MLVFFVSVKTMLGFEVIFANITYPPLLGAVSAMVVSVQLSLELKNPLTIFAIEQLTPFVDSLHVVV